MLFTAMDPMGMADTGLVAGWAVGAGAGCTGAAGAGVLFRGMGSVTQLPLPTVPLVSSASSPEWRCSHAFLSLCTPPEGAGAGAGAGVGVAGLSGEGAVGGGVAGAGDAVAGGGGGVELASPAALAGDAVEGGCATSLRAGESTGMGAERKDEGLAWPADGADGGLIGLAGGAPRE